MDTLTLYSKLAALPDDLKAEVADFAEFLMSKRKNSKQRKKPKFGSGKGMFVMKPDFDGPSDDFNKYMH